MTIRYVNDEGGLSSAAGFVENDGSRERRYVRVPTASIRLVIGQPGIFKVLSYRASKDAVRTDATSGFPGRQNSGDLARSVELIISGQAKISTVAGREDVRLSLLGSEVDYDEMRVRLSTESEATAFGFDWFSEEYLPPSGGFEFWGRIAHEDAGLLIEELRATGGSLAITVKIGLFPGFFGEWNFDGWDGGALKFVDKEIAVRRIENSKDIPADFFDPERPFRSDVEAIGPHDLVQMMVVPRRT